MLIDCVFPDVHPKRVATGDDGEGDEETGLIELEK